MQTSKKVGMVPAEPSFCFVASSSSPMVILKKLFDHQGCIAGIKEGDDVAGVKGASWQNDCTKSRTRLFTRMGLHLLSSSVCFLFASIDSPNNPSHWPIATKFHGGSMIKLHHLYRSSVSALLSLVKASRIQLHIFQKSGMSCSIVIQSLSNSGSCISYHPQSLAMAI
ncbi:unnamed protein product [Lactuca saligna]|uniref:Uncharacterized protein n=1 Tax=Lactuca saligna TaxID=75948 RepID=A0AA36EM67_LACSI|nr:unnamed protein product [Lactuca saligna]